CRFQPRAADRALGAIFLGPRRARFHEAHVAAQMRARAAARAGAGGRRAGGGGGTDRACPLGRHPPQPMSRPKTKAARQRLVAVTLDEETIGRSNPDVEHERQVAIYDLLEQNTFAPAGHDDDGPFALHLSITGNRLVFDIRTQDGKTVVAHLLSLSPLRRIVKDYHLICDSYYA